MVQPFSLPHKISLDALFWFVFTPRCRKSLTRGYCKLRRDKLVIVNVRLLSLSYRSN